MLETPGDGDLAATMAAVHGKSVAGHLSRSTGLWGWRRVEIGGCLGWGEATLPTRAGLTLLVNGRWIQSRSLCYAVDEAYRTLVQVGRFPIAVLNITVPPGDVDVNVHPRKSEVRLVHERAAFGAVQRAIRRTLGGLGAPVRLACSARMMRRRCTEDGGELDLRSAGARPGWRDVYHRRGHGGRLSGRSARRP